MTSKQPIKKGVPSRPAKTPVQQAVATKNSKPVSAATTSTTKKTPPKVVRSAKAGSSSGPKLPSARVSTALRMPKGGGKHADIQQRLKKKSPWFQSIVDPLHGADCKIPDETGVETGTCQLIHRATITANAQGIAGFKVCSPYINSEVTADSNGNNIQFIKADSTGSTIQWGAFESPGSWATSGALAFDGVQELKGITNQHRIVSACMIVQPETSLADNKGEYVLFADDFATIDSPIYDDYMNLYKSVVVPMNVSKPGQVNWFPVAREDWSFKSFIRTNGNDLENDDAQTSSYPPWTFGFLGSGLATDATFRCTVVVNYEFIPTYNTLNVLDATPSPSDATEVDLVEQWVQETPTASVITNRQASSSPSSVSPSHGESDSGTGFGMFFNVISELAPLALALL